MDPQFQRHVIILTDGQVYDSEKIVRIIKEMRHENVATTHMVGIGNGVSFDMIKMGAQNGGG